MRSIKVNCFPLDSLIIRPITKSEISFLDKMLYNAIFVAPGNERLPDNIIEHPEISKYIKDFGREGDSCFVAEINGELVGAIWTRHFKRTSVPPCGIKHFCRRDNR